MSKREASASLLRGSLGDLLVEDGATASVHASTAAAETAVHKAQALVCLHKHIEDTLLAFYLQWFSPNLKDSKLQSTATEGTLALHVQASSL